MGLPIPTSSPNSQFRPPFPETNPNIHRTDKMEERKTISPKRKFRPVTPRVTATCPPYLRFHQSLVMKFHPQ